jgi:protein SCO1/2
MLLVAVMLTSGFFVDLLVMRHLRQAKQELNPHTSQIERGPGPRLPPVTLSDQYGRPFRFTDAPGRWSFVFFGFTTCPDVCPAGMAILADAWRTVEMTPALAARGRVVLVGVDPADGPDDMRRFLAQFHPGFVGLTGSEDDIAALANATGIYIEAGPMGLAHSGAVLVVDPAGQVRRAVMPPLAADELVQIMRESLQS